MVFRSMWVRGAGLVLATVAVFHLAGCQDAPVSKSGAASKETKVAAGEPIKLCVKCGQIKGSENCCAKDAKKCGSCGLAKGSPGCCKIPEGATTAAICTKCGHIKGTEMCCKPDQKKCGKCGLVKGSAGCCKL